MTALLDLDDVVADNPLARTELAELRADYGNTVSMNLSLGLDNMELLAEQSELRAALAARDVELAEAQPIIEAAKELRAILAKVVLSPSIVGKLCRAVDIYLAAHPAKVQP